MYKAQYKKNNVYETWTTIGSYGSESMAINSAVNKKNQGVLMVRVVDSKGSVVYVG